MRDRERKKKRNKKQSERNVLNRAQKSGAAHTHTNNTEKWVIQQKKIILFKKKK